MAPTIWWLVVVPLAALSCGRIRATYFWTAAIVVTVVFFYATPVPSPVVQSYVEHELEYRAVIMAGLFIVLIVFMSYVEASRSSAFQRISESSDVLRDAAEELKQSNLNLEEARDEAIEQTELKSRLMANISHELRTPLTSVLASIDLLSLTELNSKQKELVDGLSNSGHHFIYIINDVLDFSKLEANQMRLEPEVFNLKEFFEEVIELYKIEAERKKIGLSLRLDPSMPECVDADAKRFRQIVTNLLSNAIKFTESGEVTIEATSQEWNLDKVTQLRISVADTGVGIPKEAQEHLFTAFYQVDSSLNRLEGGSGLGLAICADLAKLMGGSCSVSSEVGSGATFVCELPVMMKTAEVDAANSELPSSTSGYGEAESVVSVPHHSHHKILVVEDEELNLKLLLGVLENLGYSADAACNGQEAVEAATSNSYDVIFMDCRMPVLDGIEATRIIRANELKSGEAASKIVALTGDAQENVRESCIQAGMDLLVSKPYRLADIRNVLAILTTETTQGFSD